jgi:hypothetical protein
LPLTFFTTAHPYFKSVAPVSGASSITHIGSVFKNADTALKVYGLEAKVLSPTNVTSGSGLGVKFRLYLCNVVNGLPVLPALDSISTAVIAIQPMQFGVTAGGTFTNGPKKIIGDFAVLGRCVSSLSGDTVKFLRTAGYTATSTSAPAPAYRFGEGLGVLRDAGIFYKTTNYNNAAFGPGTDYEFCMAPMVSFSLQTSKIKDYYEEGACVYEVFTNTNTSSPELTNKQFNFNQFYRELRPFNPQAPILAGFVPDSVLTWDLGDGFAPFFLKLGIDTINLFYSAGNSFFFGTVVGKYKQSAYHVNAPTKLATYSFTNSVVWCDEPNGLVYMGLWSNVKISPNPTADQTGISGLTGENTIVLYNLFGQVLSKKTTKENSVLIDLSKLSSGVYLVKINGTRLNSKTVRIIRQ